MPQNLDENLPILGITFCLTCFVTCVVCFGLIITCVAGIAFGYNYSFAEFITYTKSDVTVYMRRGQFYDHPDIAPAPVRRMGADDDTFSSNITLEYEEQVSNKDTEPMSRKWLQDQDAREYAVKLTKYKGDEKIYVDEPELTEQEKIKPLLKSTLPPAWRLPNSPSTILTTILGSGSSQIVLRKFLPINDVTEEDYRTKEPNDDLYKDDYSKYRTKPTDMDYRERKVSKFTPDVKIRFEDIPERKLLPLRDSATKSINDEDDLTEEENVENIMYKPV